MKKILLFALCLMLAALPLGSFAEETPELPFGENPFEERDDDDLQAPETDDVQNIRLEIDGKTRTLAFDPSPEYSTVKDGMVQASFFEYDEQYDMLYELYLIFPQDIRAGDDVDVDYSIENDKECSVVVIVSDTSADTYYISGVMSQHVYPELSQFSMKFDSADGSEYAGTLSAELVALDLSSGSVIGTMVIVDAPFRFKLGEPAADRHTDPLPTAVPADMRRV